MKLKWHTEQRKISDLIPFESNPRQMTEAQVKQLTKSLQKFDLAEIPAINLDNKICAGHQRLKILQLEGRSEEIIDVRVPNRMLTNKEFQEYNLRSNKNVGDWNLDLLVNFDEDLLLDVGWEKEELGFMFQVDETMIKEKEIDDLKTEKECPKCGYKWS